MLPQNIAEFWNVCTRPTGKNGLGLTPQETEDRMKGLERFSASFTTRPKSIRVGDGFSWTTLSRESKFTARE